MELALRPTISSYRKKASVFDHTERVSNKILNHSSSPTTFAKRKNVEYLILYKHRISFLSSLFFEHSKEQFTQK